MCNSSTAMHLTSWWTIFKICTRPFSENFPLSFERSHKHYCNYGDHKPNHSCCCKEECYQWWNSCFSIFNFSPYASSNILLLNAIMNLTMVPFHLSNLTTSVPKCRFSFDQEVSLSNNKEGASIDKCIYGQTIKTNTYFIDGSWPKTIHWTIFISV